MRSLPATVGAALAARERWPVLALLVAALAAPAPAAAAPGAPAALTAPAATKAKPVLTWTAPADPGAGVAGYHVYRGATRLTTAGPVTVRTFTDSALVANGTYPYAVRAVEQGTSVEGDPAAVSVVYDTVAPPAPTNALGVSPSTSPPALSWTAGGADALSGVSHYEVSRGTSVVAGNLTATSFTDSTLTASGSYAYAIRAVDRAGNQSAALARTMVFDTVAPSSPGAFSPAPAQRSQPTLSWTAATDSGGAGIDHYEIVRGGTRIASTTATTFTDGSVTAEGSYLYAILAVDKAGNEGTPTAARTVTYDITAPGPPGALDTSDAVTRDKPALGWTAGRDPGGSGVVAYRVYREATMVGGTPALTFADTGLVSDGVYAYRVAAVDAAGNESPAVGPVTITYDKTAPPVPTALAGATPTAASPILSWTPGGPDALSGFHHFEVYRTGVHVGSLPASDAPSFTDTALTASGSQTYTVRAVDVAGNVSAASAPRTVVYDAVAPTAPTGLKAPAATRLAPALTWTAVTDVGGSGTSLYVVYRGGTRLGTSTTASYTDNAAPLNTTLTYAVSAVDRAGNEGPLTAAATVVYDTVPPDVPARPAGAATTRTKPSLAWPGAADAGSGVALYTVFRGATTAGTSPSPAFTDTSLGTSGSYDYTVRATDGAGNVSGSSPGLAVVYDSVPPPAPTALTAPSPTGVAPALSWSSGGADALSGFDHYDVFRGATLLASTTATSYADREVTASGSYSYTVKAVDVAGNVSAATAARTVAFDPTAPGPPTNLDGPSPARAPALKWTAPADAGGVSRYEVFRDGGATPIGSTATTSYIDTSATVEGPYMYTVRAVDAAGNRSGPSTSKTIVVDATPPPVPVDLVAVTPTRTKPALAWASGGPDGASGFLKYVVLRNGARVGEAVGPSFVDTTASAQGEYTYAVRAVDVAGNESASVSATVVYDNQPPPAPVGLTGPARTRTAPRLDWFPGGADALSGFSHYAVYRGAVAVGTSTAATLTDAVPPTDGVHGYTVRAVDRAGNESAATPALNVLLDRTAPSVPLGLSADSPTRGRPRLLWSAAADGTGAGVSHYLLFRAGEATPVNGAGTTTLTATDDADLADGVYDYTVRAVDAVGNVSDASTVRTVHVDTVAPPPPTEVAGTSPSRRPTLTWRASSDAGTGGSGVVGYNVYRGAVRAGSTSTTSLTDESVTANDAYGYTVTTVDGAGNESAASTPPVSILFDSVAPPAPTLALPTSPTVTKPALTWSSGGPDSLSGFDHYEVFRNGALVADAGLATSFVDDGLVVNGSYAYTVRAVDAAGNRSAPSATRTVVWDDTAPSAPPATAIDATPTNRPSVRWADAVDTGGSGLTTYRILRDGVLVGSASRPPFVDADASLGEGVHAYTVIAEDGAGNASGASDAAIASVDLTPPTTPTALRGDSPSRRPVLFWEGSADAAGTPGATPSGVERYHVYRGATLAGSVPAPGGTFTDSALTADGTYPYTVRAVDRAGNLSAPSAVVTVTFDHTAPPAPARVSAPSPRPDVPHLTWSSGGHDNLSGFHHYEVLRDGVLIAQPTTTSFRDLELSAQGPHDYVVRAVDAAGNASGASTTLKVIYDATPPAAATALAIASPTNLPHLTWDAAADDDSGGSGVDHYRVYRDGAAVGRSTTTSFDDGAVPADGSFGYAVTVVDRAGNESLPTRLVAVRFDGTAPAPPQGLSGASPTRLPVLAWAAVSDAGTGGSAIAGYRVFRDGVFIGETPGTTYADTRATTTGRYVYSVQALDAAGNTSGLSESRQVTFDAEGPVLEGIVFPATRSAGVAVPFSVRPVDALSGVQGEAVWDFGDGVATGNSVAHVFREPGTYQVTVRASDNLGNLTTVAARSITIVGPARTPPKRGTSPEGAARPGSTAPTPALRLAGPPVVTAGALRARGGRMSVVVHVRRATVVRFQVRRDGVVIASFRRRLAAGRRPVALTLPRAARRPGTLVLTATAPGRLSASARIRIR